MSDDDISTTDGTDDSTTDSTTLAVTSTYKILGEFSASDGSAVLGQNNAGTDTPVGVEGAVPNADGFGLSTPDDARIEGKIESPGGHSLTVDGIEVLHLGTQLARGSVIVGGNVIGGYNDNGVQNSAAGVTISGGGRSGSSDVGGNIGTRSDTNEVIDDYGTIGGGYNNRAGKAATVGGGIQNTADAENTTVAGGEENVAGKSWSTVGGGFDNRTSGQNATIGGGGFNRAGDYGTVPGGQKNTADGKFSFAAGRRAKTNGFDGTFVWADSTNADVTAQGADQFIVEAGGGTGIGDEDPKTTLHVKDSVAESGGDNLGRHVAAVENTSTSSSPVPDVLGLQLSNETTPTEFNSYISFMDSSGTIGNVQGNGGGGIAVRSADTLDLLANDTDMVTVDGSNKKLTVNGDIEADNKNFVQSVDTDDGEKEVVYASTEAPTPRAEVSGVAELSDGRAEIELPAHFGWVTDEGEPLHVQTTPYSAESGGLAVVEHSTDRLVVEDLDGEGDYEFSYTVKGAREGYTDEAVVREPTTDANADASSTPADD